MAKTKAKKQFEIPEGADKMQVMPSELLQAIINKMDELPSGQVRQLMNAIEHMVQQGEVTSLAMYLQAEIEAQGLSDDKA